MVPYVDAVVAVTVMRVLLFMLDVCMPRGCEGDGGGVGVMRAEHEYVGGTRGSGIVSNAADVLGMSVVRGMKGVGGVGELCMCLARDVVGGEGGEWIRVLGLGFTNPVGTGGVLEMCWCCGGVGGVGGEKVGDLDQGLEGGVMSV